MSYKSYRKDVRHSLDPHLAVDPEDRTYLTDDLTMEGDDFVKELRKGFKTGGSGGRSYRSDLERIERRVGETFDPHRAVDPEDRPYLMDDMAGDDSGYIEEGRRPNKSKAYKKTKDSYKARRFQDSDIRPDSKLDVIAIDGSAGADRALLYAARNLPKDRSLLLVHGVHSRWMGGTDESEIREIEDHYAGLCQKAGRECRFKTFSYTSTTDFGDQVCQYAERQGAASVIIGRRENISNMRRALMGSSSQAVMNSCYVPVTIVGTSITSTKTKQY
jgi:nucleotide-binding universal stress UspA family protein